MLTNIRFIIFAFLLLVSVSEYSYIQILSYRLEKMSEEVEIARAEAENNCIEQRIKDIENEYQNHFSLDGDTLDFDWMWSDPEAKEDTNTSAETRAMRQNTGG